MEQERSIDRLARYLIIAATLAILAYLKGADTAAKVREGLMP